MKKIILKFRMHVLGSFFLVIAGSLSAQTVKVTGVVRDGSGNPLQGASVFLKNKQQGTVTDSNGHYELMVKTKQSMIVASFIGYAQQEKTVDITRRTTELDFAIAEVYKECAEVVIVCTPQEKKSKAFLSERKSAELIRSQMADLLKKN